jgi:hypothetical protein
VLLAERGDRFAGRLHGPTEAVDLELDDNTLDASLSFGMIVLATVVIAGGP